jgi:hypothetical protein
MPTHPLRVFAFNTSARANCFGGSGLPCAATADIRGALMIRNSNSASFASSEVNNPICDEEKQVLPASSWAFYRYW